MDRLQSRTYLFSVLSYGVLFLAVAALAATFGFLLAGERGAWIGIIVALILCRAFARSVMKKVSKFFSTSYAVPPASPSDGDQSGATKKKNPLGKYLYVYNHQDDEFPARYRILAEGESSSAAAGEDITGVISGAEVSEVRRTLEAEYPKPAYAVTEAWANCWSAVANNHRGLDYEYD